MEEEAEEEAALSLLDLRDRLCVCCSLAGDISLPCEAEAGLSAEMLLALLLLAARLLLASDGPSYSCAAGEPTPTPSPSLSSTSSSEVKTREEAAEDSGSASASVSAPASW